MGLVIADEKPMRSKGTVEVAPGFKLWREVVCTALDYHGMDVTATGSWSTARSQLSVTRLDIRQREEGGPITAELIRQIPVTPFLRRAFLASVRAGLTPEGAEDLRPRRAFGLVPIDTAVRCRALGPVAETLEWVALVYRAAAAIGDNPTKAVRETFEISQSTAGAWVSAARRAGHLSESQGPGKVQV